ncbi:MAG: calcium/sodium antiporter [Bacteroidaceae bacterium]|nr:calcium/sodium antiporter [Bacteroidaceae bacterium]MBQ5616203.1 calcium/sodium antiporter [Bacteroidaceae bacterium]
MFLSIISFIVGIVLVILGADWLTKGASGIARRFGVSELVIGLTIVALGTSLPELVISVGSAIKGSSGIALGNVIGSNIFNGLLILGVTALIAPIRFNSRMLTREIPFNLLASVVLILVSGSMLVGGGAGEYITRYSGLLLLCFLAVFVRYTFSIPNDDDDEALEKPMSIGKVLLFILLGLAGLIFGGNIFVNGATELARVAGLSEAVIGITVVSAGSSLPELAVSVSAARKGNVGIALGNVLGSNILNIFLILGCSATITPISLDGFSFVDFYVLLASSLLIYIVTRFGGKAVINRIEGVLLVSGYIAYTTYLIMNA